MDKITLSAGVFLAAALSQGCKTTKNDTAVLKFQVSPEKRLELLKALPTKPSYDQIAAVMLKILPNIKSADNPQKECFIGQEVMTISNGDDNRSDDYDLLYLGATYKTQHYGITPHLSYLPREKIYRPFKLGERFSFPKSFETDITFEKPTNTRNSFQLTYTAYGFYGEWFASRVTKSRSIIEFNGGTGKAQSFFSYDSISKQDNLTGLITDCP